MEEGYKATLKWKLEMMGEDPSILDNIECKAESFMLAFTWADTPQGAMYWHTIDRIWRAKLFTEEQIRHELKRYAHAEGCNEIEVCPQEHPACEEELGLNTAMAWLAATEDAESWRILSYLDALSLHSTRYPLLFAMLSKFYEIVMPDQEGE